MLSTWYISCILLVCSVRATVIWQRTLSHASVVMENSSERCVACVALLILTVSWSWTDWYVQLLRWNKRILLSYSEYLINSVFKQQLMEWSWVGALQAALGWISLGAPWQLDLVLCVDCRLWLMVRWISCDIGMSGVESGTLSWSKRELPWSPLKTNRSLLDWDSSVPVACNPSLTLQEEQKWRPVSRLGGVGGSET